MKKIIISVSRRTDIPAYYSDWFIKRVKLAYVYYPNPFSQKPIYVSLKPEDVKAIVFWTRNPKPLFKHLDFIDERYYRHHYMHFTINGMPKILENRNPSITSSISAAELLAKRYGKDYIQWRFDPIIISDITTEKFVINSFKEIAKKLQGITKRCYISFVDLYEKTKKNISIIEKKYGIKFYKPSLKEQIEIVKELIDIGKENKIKLYACVEDQLLEHLPELNKAHCVDIDLISKICKDEPEINYEISPSRPGCGCYESKDIGYYDSCPHGCIYCYANKNPEKSLKNARKYLKEGFPLDKIYDEKKVLNNNDIQVKKF